MLDIKFLRANPEAVKKGARDKGVDVDIDELLALDDSWRRKVYEVEQLKARRNKVSEEIGLLRKAGQDASNAIAEMRRVAASIKALDEEVRGLKERIDRLLLEIPNLPHPTVPVGPDETANEEVKRWGEPPAFDFDWKPHWELAAELDIIDFERAAKMSGARFPLLKGLGARLERALINFMLDLHTTEHGYREVFPPFLVNAKSMYGTGQLPKFEEDMFKVGSHELYLIPTAEVPVTNIHREEVLEEDELPLYYTAYSACFRAEAGAAGRDTRGLIRNHQFNKVELVKFTTPEQSYEELESLLQQAEAVLQRLELPYRVVCLSTGDMTFASAKTYDIEVWMPSSNAYREISSCSNFEDFQARRAEIRYRPRDGGRLRYVHTLNGSGLAVGRTVAAILENYQQEDGTVKVPDALVPYMGGVDRIS